MSTEKTFSILIFKLDVSDDDRIILDFAIRSTREGELEVGYVRGIPPTNPEFCHLLGKQGPLSPDKEAPAKKTQALLTSSDSVARPQKRLAQLRKRQQFDAMYFRIQNRHFRH